MRRRPPFHRLATALLTALGALVLMVAGGAPGVGDWTDPTPAEAPVAAVAEAPATTTRHRRRRTGPLRPRRPRSGATGRCRPRRAVVVRTTHRSHDRPPRRGPPARSATVR